MRILWIEDFPDEMGDQKSTSEKMFKDLINNGETFYDLALKDEIHIALPKYFKLKSIHEIEICYSREIYEIEFKEKLFNFDIFIIDINLSAKTGYSQEVNDYSKWDGFGIYTDMIRLGLNEQNISLMTANSNELKEVCNGYTIPIPSNLFIKDIKKDKDGQYKKIKDESGYLKFREWLQIKANTPYLQLRRGILDGCKELKEFIETQKDDEKCILLNKCIKKDFETKLPEVILEEEYGLEYLNLLKSFFLKEFALDEANKRNTLRTFLLLLSAEWERTYIETGKPISSYDDLKEKDFHSVNFWILKNLRNNLSHFSFTDDISEKDVAFFFILAMRNFFDLELKEYPFERILFSVTSKNKIYKDLSDLKKINKKNKEELLLLCKNKNVKDKKIRKEKPETCENCKQKIGNKEKTFDWTDFQMSDSYLRIAYAFMEIKNNKNGDSKEVKKEDLKQYTKMFFYHAFLSEMETILGDANSKDKLFYKLGAFALEASSKK